VRGKKGRGEGKERERREFPLSVESE